ncbi:hypothetical protein F4679DRAFT_526931 [Xylaria curta]|nr:hypothetical protein F4679DRAFT_526931 [Xylaria curta]
MFRLVFYPTWLCYLISGCSATTAAHPLAYQTQLVSLIWSLARHGQIFYLYILGQPAFSLNGWGSRDSSPYLGHARFSQIYD